MKTILNHARLVALVCAPLVGVAAPVLVNGSFESEFEGWTHGRAIAVVAGDAADGERRAVFDVPSGTRAVLQTEIEGLLAGRAYELRYQSRGSTSDDIRVVVRDPVSSRYLASARPSTEAAWTPHALRFVAPGSLVRLEVRAVSGGQLEVDHFSIVAVD